MSYDDEVDKDHYLIKHEGPSHPIHLPLAVRDAHPVMGTPLMLLLALALRAKTSSNFSRCSCFPSYATLAEDTGLSVKTLKRSAIKLEELELIKRQSRGKHHSLFWHVNAVKIWAMARAEHAKELALKKAQTAVWEEERAEANSYEFDGTATGESLVDGQSEEDVDAMVSYPDESAEGTPVTPPFEWCPGGIRPPASTTPVETGAGGAE